MKNDEIVTRNNHMLENLDNDIETINYFVNKTYLNQLTGHKVIDLPKYIEDEKINTAIRLFKLEKIIYDKNEDFLDKLSNIYSAISNVGASVILIIQSKGVENEIYLGVRNNNINSDVNLAKEVMEKSFQGNFPGSELKILRNKRSENLISEILGENNNSENIISAVTAIPSLKANKEHSFVQGLEKLIDSMRGHVFSAVFISDPISNENLEQIKFGYQDMYSSLKPFASSNLTLSQSEALGISETLTEGVTDSINSSISKTQNYTKTESKNTSKTNSISKGTFKGGNAGVGVGFNIGIGGMYGKNSGTSNSTTNSQTLGNSTTNGKTSTQGKSTSTTTQESKSTTSTKTDGTSHQITLENKYIADLLKQIEKHIDRINECKNFGMWNCSAYFIGEDSQTAKIASSNFKSLISGELSYIENATINTWGGDNENLPKVTKYLKKLHHPIIDVGIDIENKNSTYVTPGAIISGKELPIQLGLPKKSVSGLVVMEMAEFGRSVIPYDIENDETIKLGKIFHMGKEDNVDVELNLNSLTMHTFVTGSTGAGKSNLIYKLLDEIDKKDKTFLVIEPTKGEYKEVFGGRKNVNVFGTNPKFTELLKINPFKFDDEIHVLEHIDRLIEIFSACWPMYAAMPAVFKEAIEMSYKRCYWDLDDSECNLEIKQFPTFYDLLYSLEEVIKNSAYSDEVKSNYIGALCTRVRSMTNGLLGKIFTNNDIEDSVLFDQNTIIDLSRVGSTETKALIMGILFIKLQEYRMINKTESNSKLKHITVMEEAHNLLRKVSVAQTEESSNLQGKSVEMISNSIAEMRTYGEGFIIADQAPNLLDDSVIRNTNTKIIFRLPDQDDRQNVGKSAVLNEDQINEIPKLKTGVGVIYQNNWMQAVLCKISKFTDRNPLNYTSKSKNNRTLMGDLIKILLKGRIQNKDEINISPKNINNVKSYILKEDILKYKTNLIINEIERYRVKGYINLWNQDKFDELCEIIDLLIGRKFVIREEDLNELDEFNHSIIEKIRKYADLNQNIKLEKSLIQCMLSKRAKEGQLNKEVYFRWIQENRFKKEVIK